MGVWDVVALLPLLAVLLMVALLAVLLREVVGVLRARWRRRREAGEG